MSRPGPRILDRHRREGPKVDTAEGLAKSPWCAAPCDAHAEADAALTAPGTVLSSTAGVV
jgi:hypothetical protein